MVAIIGAGISGLVLAYELSKKNIPYQLFELSENQGKEGGIIQSKRDKEYLFEFGPNSLLADDEIIDFIKELGLEEDLEQSQPVSKNRYIYKKGKYRKLPSSPVELIFSTFFSRKTKLAILKERSNTTTTSDHETLTQFFERRFSREIVEYALDPFVSGIYAGNPDELLVSKTFPQLLEYEAKYGSVIKGFAKNKPIRRQSLSFTEGLQALPHRLAEEVKITFLEKGIEKIGYDQKEGHWQLEAGKQSFSATHVVLSLPAYQAARLVETWHPGLQQSLLKIAHSSMMVAHSIYYKQDIKASLNGFGGLHPSKENLFTLGHIWTSSVFNGHCKENEVMFTSFIGGSRGFEKTLLEDYHILGKVHQEIKQLYHIDAMPVIQQLYRWPKAIPQYDKYCLEAHAITSELESLNLWVCANWKGGVSLSDCIKKAKKLAEKLNH